MRIYVGYDARQDLAYRATVASMTACSARPLDVSPIVEAHCRALSLYRRRHEMRDGRVFDRISDAPMSTQFAITRFLVPALAARDRVRDPWALFCDSDFLFLADVGDLMRHADPRFAVLAVQHDHRPTETAKMDGQVQTAYPRKNWSSLVLWNLEHPAHRRLVEADLANRVPGRDLHAFCWLEDDEIGALPAAWNWLEGYDDPAAVPKAVHYTRGTPDMIDNAAFAAEWWSWLR
ncbi:MAG: hypothetical protein R8L07_03450 [Alphaproteobacteria bacterium]|nr:hypothetical protein [Alphaproteobacteria bacterium]